MYSFTILWLTKEPTHNVDSLTLQDDKEDDARTNNNDKFGINEPNVFPQHFSPSIYITPMFPSNRNHPGQPSLVIGTALLQQVFVQGRQMRGNCKLYQSRTKRPSITLSSIQRVKNISPSRYELNEEKISEWNSLWLTRWALWVVLVQIHDFFNEIHCSEKITCFLIDFEKRSTSRSPVEQTEYSRPPGAQKNKETHPESIFFPLTLPLLHLFILWAEKNRTD